MHTFQCILLRSMWIKNITSTNKYAKTNTGLYTKNFSCFCLLCHANQLVVVFFLPITLILCSGFSEKKNEMKWRLMKVLVNNKKTSGKECEGNFLSGYWKRCVEFFFELCERCEFTWTKYCLNHLKSEYIIRKSGKIGTSHSRYY